MVMDFFVKNLLSYRHLPESLEAKCLELDHLKKSFLLPQWNPDKGLEKLFRIETIAEHRQVLFPDQQFKKTTIGPRPAPWETAQLGSIRIQLSVESISSF